jgi:hypothetical protein
MRKLVLAVVLVAAALTFVLASTALADHDNGGNFRTNLDGYQEVVGGGGPSSGSVSTVASGRFTARLRNGVLEYTLTYSNMEGGAVTQAHIHFAQEHVGGGVIAFLCGGGDKRACLTPSDTITGTIDPADVIGPANQGIESGSFAELVSAMRAGATYANVHSTRWPMGEIRGQINGGRGGDDDDDD